MILYNLRVHIIPFTNWGCLARGYQISQEFSWWIERQSEKHYEDCIVAGIIIL